MNDISRMEQQSMVRDSISHDCHSIQTSTVLNFTNKIEVEQTMFLIHE
jgi:hypothetical protein